MGHPKPKSEGAQEATFEVKISFWAKLNGSPASVLRDHTHFGTSREFMGIWRLNPGWSHAKQAPSLAILSLWSHEIKLSEGKRPGKHREIHSYTTLDAEPGQGHLSAPW